MAALTERRLVTLLAERFQVTAAPDVQLAIGDDAAVLAPAPEPTVVSVDASVEGVHFDLRYLRYEDVGYRAFQAAVSDLAAMGAVPTAALSSLILPRSLPPGAVDQLTAGQAAASRETCCPVVGGNISRGAELSVTTTVIGRASAPLQRSGARPGEQLWLVGELGLAAAGLAFLRLRRGPGALEPVLDAEKTTGHGDEPALRACVDAWRRPQALLSEGRELVGRASAAIDVSDGLAADAGQLARASRVRIVVDRAQLRLSLAPALLIAQRSLRRAALGWALAGGEDYALLATGPSALRPPCAVPIGYVAHGTGVFLAAEGRLEPLSGGFDHLR